MSNNSSGGQKVRKTLLGKYGSGYYSNIGKIGGSKTNPEKGFGAKVAGPDGLTGKERAAKVGARGGRISSRRKDKE